MPAARINVAEGLGYIALLPSLAAAVLFGAAAPASKILLGNCDPLSLASLLYLGSGLGLAGWLMARKALTAAPRHTSALRGKDWFVMSGAVLAGGVAAPFLFMVALSLSPASTVSLILNLEMVFTAVLAWLLFREGFELRVALGLAAVAGGCLVLSWPGAGIEGWGFGAPAAVAACLCWGLDNNLTQRLADRDPIQIAALKGLVGGVVNGALALALGKTFPSILPLSAALGVGLLGYGLSLVLFIVSLGRIGTARTMGVFAAAPFVGATLAFTVLGEPLSPSFAVGAIVVAVGLFLALTAHHAHQHTHPDAAHSHVHIHDDHHRHEHGPEVLGEEPHGHEHIHNPMEHAHPHYPDTHHRHDH